MQNWAGTQQRYEYEIPGGNYNTRPARPSRKRKKGLQPKDKKLMLACVLLAGFMGIMVIVSVAYSATINFKNNQLKSEITALEGEVESLEIDIQSASNIAVVEKTAASKLGMEYAEGDKCVEITPEKYTGRNFAAKLKRAAFN